MAGKGKKQTGRVPNRLRVGRIPAPQRVGWRAMIDLAANDPRLLQGIVLILSHVEVGRRVPCRTLAKTLSVRPEVAVELLNEDGLWMRWIRHVLAGNAAEVSQPLVGSQNADLASQFRETLGNTKNGLYPVEPRGESGVTR